METNTELDPEINEDAIPEMVTSAEESVSEGRFNLDICPNCLEPNPDDLAVCQYCGMPLHPGAEADPSAMPEDEAKLAAARAEAAAAAKKDEKKKQQQGGFRRVMPWLGLYLIYYAITGIIETSRQEELSNPTLAYASWVIYIVAGLLMSWPLIKKGYRKLRHLPEEDEVTEESTENTDENTPEGTVEPAELPDAIEDASELPNDETEPAVPETDPDPEPEMTPQDGPVQNTPAEPLSGTETEQSETTEPEDGE